MAWELGKMAMWYEPPKEPKSLTAGGPIPVVHVWEDKLGHAHVVEVVCPPMTTKTFFAQETLAWKFANNEAQMADYITHTVMKSLWDAIHEQVRKSIQAALNVEAQKIEGYKAVLMSPAFAIDPSKKDAFLSTWSATTTPLDTPTDPLGADVHATLVDLVPNIRVKVAHPPAPGEPCTWSGYEQDLRLDRLIMHLNDSHKWTREQIADWLETLDVDLSFKTPEGDL